MSIPEKLRALFVLLPFGVAACSGMLDSNEPAERTYWLQPLLLDGSSSNDGSRPGISVSIGAAPGLDTDRLLILEQDARLNYYAAARWPDHAPEVLSSALRATLESTGSYSRVMKSANARAAGWQLELEIREMYVQAANAGTPQTASWSLSGYVVCEDVERPISLFAAVSTDAERLGRILLAHQQALDSISRQLVKQLLAACGAPLSADGTQN